MKCDGHSQRPQAHVLKIGFFCLFYSPTDKVENFHKKCSMKPVVYKVGFVNTPEEFNIATGLITYMQYLKMLLLQVKFDFRLILI